MNRRDAQSPGLALRRLGPLTILGCAFLVGGVLGGLLASLIAGTAQQELVAFLSDYLAAAGEEAIQVEFWPMLWEQGRFFFGICLLGVTAVGVAGIPILFLVLMH